MTDETVTVNLSVQRMYRANHEDRTAITVGPGEVQVPKWVADEWAKPHPDQQKASDKSPELQEALAEIERIKAAYVDLETRYAASQAMDRTLQEGATELQGKVATLKAKK